eukprot:TRINITY_DN54604_c0_g1_i1.p1 TRINITY_DN54604_c0_g1~~TRINITY_DN54604_c0_g1_i1.p1  ORF type:complete len:390 (-),score=88.13 TRINITY_DN54604_c0_g1_i1:298-1467(-)
MAGAQDQKQPAESSQTCDQKVAARTQSQRQQPPSLISLQQEPQELRAPQQREPSHQDAKHNAEHRQQDESQPPPSPFVTRLRGEVALARDAPAWEQQPSIGTWLTPRGTRRVGPGVTFAEGSTPRSWRKPGPSELRFKGSGLKPFKLEGLPTGLVVRDIKALCERYCQWPPDHQRLLYKGKILQDTQQLEDLEISSGATLFLVRGVGPSGAAAASSRQEEEEKTPKKKKQDDEHNWLTDQRFGRVDERSLEDMDEGHLISVLMMGRPCWECGVNPGRLQTDGMCSVCFRDMVIRENALMKERKREEEARRKDEEEKKLEEERQKQQEYEKRQKERNRCKFCNKRTGLTGFECRCGFYYCATHRHAEDHGCTFDHRAHGREILAQQNPGV